MKRKGLRFGLLAAICLAVAGCSTNYVYYDSSLNEVTDELYTKDGYIDIVMFDDANDYASVSEVELQDTSSFTIINDATSEEIAATSAEIFDFSKSANGTNPRRMDGTIIVRVKYEGLEVGETYHLRYVANFLLDGTTERNSNNPGTSYTDASSFTVQGPVVLTYDMMGVLENVTQNYFTGNAITKIEDPVMDGYVFLGWFTDQEFTSEFDFTNEITEDMTIYAKWEKIKKDEPVKDKEVTESNPNTADGVLTYFLIGFMSLCGIALLSLRKKIKSVRS